MNRRLFLSTASALLAARATWSAERAQRPLRVLILGGTQFLGVHITERAVARGHTVTLFNRGRTHADLFPQLEKLQGDRDGQLDALKGRSWDVVIDDSGYVPRHVRLSAELLAPSVHHYIYVSSISAYASFAHPNDENSPLGKLDDESIEKITETTYGPMKALCEKAVLTALPGRASIVRPGYVVGPNDHTDRFTYWPARAARGGEMLVPGTPRDPIQFIDVRDLARFTIDIAERNVRGTFNLVTPPGKYTMGQLIQASVASANALAHPTPPATPTWVPADFLAKNDSTLEADIPIWSPPTGDSAGAAEVSVARALRAGLHITPIAETVRDTLAWHLSRPAAERERLKAGLAPAREQELLAAWHQSAPGRAAG